MQLSFQTTVISINTNTTKLSTSQVNTQTDVCMVSQLFIYINYCRQLTSLDDIGLTPYWSQNRLKSST